MEGRNQVGGGRWQRAFVWLRRYRLYAIATLVALLIAAISPFLRRPASKLREQIAVRNATYFEEDQFLVAGMRDDVDVVINETRERLGERKVTLELLTTVELGFFAELGEDCPVTSMLIEGRGAYVIDQYQFTGEMTEQQVLDVVDTVAEDLGVAVSPELNYRIGRPPAPLQGDPWSVGGGPWSVGGGALTADELAAEADNAFWAQWAFATQGINLNAITPKDPEAGQGVRVGIFDTSPFPVTASSVAFSMTYPLTLTLSHPTTGALLDPSAGLPNVADHGLSVAGLVHGVAPGSEIHLIRVLDDSAQGNVQILNAAVNDFITQTLQDKSELNGAVINFSLGVHPPPEGPPPEVGKTASTAKSEPALSDKVQTLKNILDGAECLDIVVVAASGNDSADHPPVQPQRPARWASTIGVAASNVNKQRSCFSNCGQVAAPGGEGTPEPNSKSQCVPAIDQCIAAESTGLYSVGGCPYAVMSLALSPPSGYAYWAGTSFATPLISGLATRIIDAEGGWISKNEVLTEMAFSSIAVSCVDTSVADAYASLSP